MFTNELKKGDRVLLRNGWKATIEDNKRGNIRLATVEGFYTEMGSVYAHDIRFKLDSEDFPCEDIEHTAAQLKLRQKIESF